MVVIHRIRKTHIRYTARNEDGYVAEVRIEENGKNKRNKRKQDRKGDATDEGCTQRMRRNARV